MLANYPAHSCWLFFNEIERHHCHFQTLRLFRKVRAFLTGLCFLVRIMIPLRPLQLGDGEVDRLGLSLRNN